MISLLVVAPPPALDDVLCSTGAWFESFFALALAPVHFSSFRIAKLRFAARAMKLTTFLLFSYCVQSTGHNSNDIGVSKILQCYAMLAQFEDLDYCVQLTGHNKQKTGHNSGGIILL